MIKNKLTWTVFGFVVANDTADSIAQVLMKMGLGSGGDSMNAAEVFRVLFAGPASYLLWAGVAIYALNFFLWILILSKLDLSIAVPVASTNYITLPILAMIFLHESIPPLRWVGIGFIILGIHFVSKSTLRVEKELL
ncbi:MAG: EamA family transporter [Candidatus Omnitrophota bacterium]